MSDSDGKWVVPALLVLVLVGVSTIGLAYPDSSRSPENILDEWKNGSFGKTVDGWFSRELIRPCAASPRPLCCVGQRVEMEGTCLMAIPPAKDGVMRRIGMRTAKSSGVTVKVEAFAEDKKHSHDLEWKAVETQRVRATADFGAEPAALVISCVKSCTVDFE
jgi:hypothetical protein